MRFTLCRCEIITPGAAGGLANLPQYFGIPVCYTLAFILQTSRRASDNKTEAEAMDEDVDLTFDDEKAQAQFEDIPQVPESVPYAAGLLADISSNKYFARKEQELVY